MERRAALWTARRGSYPSNQGSNPWPPTRFENAKLAHVFMTVYRTKVPISGTVRNLSFIVKASV